MSDESKAARLKKARAERTAAQRAWEAAFEAWVKAENAKNEADHVWLLARRKVRAIEAEP